MAIQYRSGGLNPALGSVSKAPVAQAGINSYAERARSKMANNLRKINEANKSMAEYKQKQEKKKLNSQTVSYLQSLSKSNDPATQEVFKSLNLNPENNKEMSAFVEILGGPKSTLTTISDAINSTKDVIQSRFETQTDLDKARLAQERSQTLGGMIAQINSGQPVTNINVDPTQAIPAPFTPQTKGEAISFLLQSGATVEEVDKIKDMISIPEGPDATNDIIDAITLLNATVTEEDTLADQLNKLYQQFPEDTAIINQLQNSIKLITPEDDEPTVDEGKEVTDDIKKMGEYQKTSPYKFDFKKGIIKYNNKIINPGDREYERLRDMFPDGVNAIEFASGRLTENTPIEPEGPGPESNNTGRTAYKFDGEFMINIQTGEKTFVPEEYRKNYPQDVTIFQ